ncbi:MFS transporter [Bacillus safensis]|uniref:MFS transporter n=1 Tax=Bacillus safensis TaxID=561879 RepID=UPI000B42D170|nr:MFS transporter [Bacillus safensis]MCY7493469.1 MFS transporter [Bacillus safensis]MED4991121.1 MFS transporter [Bacillus safensis]UDB47868.1 MFS transporter [Bacillus safensis]
MSEKNKLFFTKIGIPYSLRWGYLGMILFMIGDGLEQGWLSPYLVERGLSVTQSAQLFAAYGLAVGIAAWVSGVLAQIWGIRRVMWAGFIMFTISSIPFIALGVSNLNYPVMLVTYVLRGVGYPLFAYSFIVWITYRAEQKILARAVGWFWFVFTCGLNVAGPFYSSIAIPMIGHIYVLYTGIFFVLIGAIIALVLTKDEVKQNTKDQSSIKELLSGIFYMFERPRLAVGAIVKIIGTLGQYGFAIFLPSYLIKYGYSTEEWLQIWSSIFVVNILSNLLFGFIGDRIGWRKTIIWFGCVGCALSTIAIYIAPMIIGHNLIGMILISCLFGFFLAGYVPITALIPSMAPTKDRGAAMSVHNLGSGLSVFVAPFIVSLFIEPLGTSGVILIFAALYLFSGYLTTFLKTHEELEQNKKKTAIQMNVLDKTP